MRIAICDDDEQELARLAGLVAEYQLSRGESLNCRPFHSGIDFLCDVKGGEYDLVLLDVLLPGVGGIQIAQELRKLDQSVKLIFISSSPEFAVESYHVGAYHYLLKPTDADSLFPLLDRVESELSAQEEQGFILKSREGIVRISYARLEYVEVINKTVFFHFSDGEIREAAAALADFEAVLLTRPEFLKTHRSYLINLDYVESIGINCVVTRNGHSVPVSRKRRSEVREVYMRFIHQTGAVTPVCDAQAVAVSESPGRLGGPWQILLVDDDPAESDFWADILRQHGCIVQTAGSGEDAVSLVSGGPCDCVLLDVMIPGEDGFAICERLRRLTKAPVIFLSCMTETDKQLEGFAAGGIDYITKDTPAALFWAKIETHIRLAVSDRTELRYGPLLLDLSGHRTMIDGKELPLTPVEFDILYRLSEQAEHIFTPEEIYGMIWGDQPWDGGQMVQMHMSRLRRKLETACDRHHFIETVWGQGYRFVPEEHSCYGEK